ncbi:MAG: M48 family metallopeptidase [Bdellovibrionota bacterium]|nr:MAG: M48 family metallopeptidase [Bdellovibrionota bacterium]
MSKLSDAAGAGNNPWHVYVFEDASVKNAAATRGNFIFIWSGMFDVAKSDDELATVLAHEIGHVLAGHTQPTPEEAVSEMLAEIAGGVTGQVVYSQGGYYGMAADLAAVLVREGLKAMIVNPESQRKELEADHIGMFLMADAGYAPESAIDFWERVQGNPEFGVADALGFFSSHPSSAERIAELRKLLPQAQARFRGIRSSDSFATLETDDSFAVDYEEASRVQRDHDRIDAGEPFPMQWKVRAFSTEVHTEPYAEAPIIAEIARGAPVKAVDQRGDWLKIVEPEQGFVRIKDLDRGR